MNIKRSFGIVFDISGVILNGKKIIPNTQYTLKKLKDLKYNNIIILFSIPFLFATNGGGIFEKEKAQSLSQLLDVNINENQILLCHTPYKSLVNRYSDARILV